jgi:hypothetical protein
MSDFLDYLWKKWNVVRQGSTPVPTVEMISSERCFPEESAGYLIKTDQMYFTVRVNQMHLAANRKWWVTYDPLVVVVVEFDYGDKRVAIPKIVGPALIPDPVQGGAPEHGVIVEDTLIVGPHPYRGGDVTLSVRFYRLQRDDLVRSILATVGTLSKAVANLKELESAIAIGSAILDGLEGLLRLKTTVCLAAFRNSLAPAVHRPFRAQSGVLVTPPAPSNISDLRVVSGRLHIDTPAGVVPYRDSDFVLLSVEGIERREDLKPFSSRKVEALKALNDGKDGSIRAKSLLLTVYNDMLDSPDMTVDQADEVYSTWRSELVKRERLVNSRQSLSKETAKPPVGRKDVQSERLNRAVEELKF